MASRPDAVTSGHYPSAANLLDHDVYERIAHSMNHEEGDRVPIWDFIDNWPTYQHFAPGIEDPIQAGAKVFHGLGIDLCRGVTFPTPPEAEGHEQEQASGHKTKILGRTRWVSERPYKSPADLKHVQPGELSVEHVREVMIPDFVRAQQAFAPRTMYVPGCGCGFHGAYHICGLTVFALAIYDARDDVERIVDRLSRNAATVAQVYAELKLCPLFFVGDDVAYKGTTMFSPQTLRELFIPALARVCEPLNNAGIKVIFHSDGDVTDIIDDMLEVGIAGLNPIEPLAGMDIGYLKKRYGRDLILVGNLDCSQLLPLGTIAQIREGVKACLRAAAPGGGHFIGSSSEITPSTPLENVLAFYDACREFGRYPLRL